jgi:FdhD protein
MSATVRHPVTVWPGGVASDDVLVVEEPLEIRIEGTSLAVTMRTPGHDLELAAGFLLTEGVIDGPDDLVAIAHVDVPGDVQGNTVDAVLAGGVEAHREAVARATRELYATSACGLCGKASIDRLRVICPPVQRRFEIDMALLATLPDRLRKAQDTFSSTGGLHAAGLFSPTGDLLLCREDIGRHNAVDKVLGHRLLADEVPVDDCILVVSGRIGFEIAQKAAVAGVPVLAAVGAASSLAVELAGELGLSLFGFVRDGRVVRYS